MTSSLLEGLNPVQQDAVNHGEGPLLVLAGAGSGKTRVLTHRIARLLAAGEQASGILALTFTNRAAQEMRHRIRELLGGEGELTLKLSTFHALGAWFLRQHGAALGRSQNFSIYDTGDQAAALRAVLEERGTPLPMAEIKKMLRSIGEAKNMGLEAADADFSWSAPGFDSAVLGLAYDQRLERADAFDFGDLILRPVRLLAADAKLMRRYRRRWKWILVDEFQDTNVAQYAWLKLLAPPGKNLFVVGDDDQAIYGWRGAEVGNILRFPEEYPSARVVRLEQNYRSDGHILDAANHIIAHNEHRLGKSLWTDRGLGSRIEYYDARNGRAEAYWVAGQIQRACVDEGYRPADVAVLMRANHLSLDLERSFRALVIPYQVLRGRAFFERAEVRDALAYIRLLTNPADEMAFRRAVNTPTRGVGKTSLAHLAKEATLSGRTLWATAADPDARGRLRGRARGGVDRFIALMNRHRGDDTLGPAERACALLMEAGVLPEDDHSLMGEAEEQRFENVRRLLEDIRSYQLETPTPSLAGYLERVQLVSDIDAIDPERGAVSLMTVHAAKGLEFPLVFVIGMEDGLFPHANAIKAGSLEEERRLCYVAVTRAMERLYLSRARERRGFGEVRRHPPSRFLAELPRDAVLGRAAPPTQRIQRDRLSSGDFATRAWPTDAFSDALHVGEVHVSATDDLSYRPGMKIWHSQLGAGRVVTVGRGLAGTLTVDFPDVGELNVRADYVSPYDG